MCFVDLFVCWVGCLLVSGEVDGNVYCVSDYFVIILGVVVVVMLLVCVMLCVYMCDLVLSVFGWSDLLCWCVVYLCGVVCVE